MFAQMFQSEMVVFKQNLPTVTDEDERRVVEVVSRLAEEVRKRRILVYPYFKDFDRVCINLYNHYFHIDRNIDMKVSVITGFYVYLYYA